MGTRQRSWAQTVSPTGGGGSVPTIGNLQWGPDFGEGNGNDGKTFGVGVSVAQPAVALAGNSNVGIHPQLTSLVISPLGSTNGVHIAGTADGAPYWQSSSTNSGSATSTATLTITPPSGIQDGDLLLAFIANSGAGAAVTSIPTGWTLKKSEVTSASPSLWCYTKTAASESGSYSWGLSATATLNYVGGIHRINGVNATPVDTSVSSTGSAVSPVTSAITTGFVNCIVIHGVAQTAATAPTFTPPSGYAERWDLSGGTVLPVSETSATRIYAAAGTVAAQTFTGTSLAASQYATISISIRPGTVTMAT